MSEIAFHETIPTLRMFSVEKTIEFYVGFLGFSVDFEHRFGENFPLFMQVSRAGLKLCLSEHHGDGSPGVHVTVRMTGLDAFHAEITAKDYRYMKPGIQHTPWNTRDMGVIDPVGNHITFSEAKA
jgi:catechol 2,3-dioxygenase-like lactoylglutathione lyase family enzyme